MTLEQDIQPDLYVQGDQAQLRQLVGILLDNACKYAGPGGSVALRLERQQERVRLSVHNTGKPIPREEQEHLFERFYRAEKSRAREEGGYGLGLAIAKSIVESHKGKITVESGVEGVTFFVFLPAGRLAGT